MRNETQLKKQMHKKGRISYVQWPDTDKSVILISCT